MIKHGIKNDELRDYEEEVTEYLEVEAMPECVEKHMKLVILNPDNYRSWKKIISKFSSNPKDIEIGLRLTLKALQTNPKSYCAWNSRAFYFAHAGNIEMETKLCKLLLFIDPRNFHCWNHCRRFGLKIPLDYTNYSSLHNALTNLNNGIGRSVENLFAGVDDEGAWAYFLKCDTNLVDLRVFVDCEYMNIHFKQPFTGVIRYEKQNHEINIPMLVFKIKNKIGTNVKRIDLNGIEYKMKKKEEPAQINEILKLRPECVYALREKLKYLREESMRTEIIDKLIRIDRIRMNYYKSLEKKIYDIYNLYNDCERF